MSRVATLLICFTWNISLKQITAATGHTVTQGWKLLTQIIVLTSHYVSEIVLSIKSRLRLYAHFKGVFSFCQYRLKSSQVFLQYGLDLKRPSRF